MSVKYNHPKGHHELCFLTSLGFQCELKHLPDSHNSHSHHLKGLTVTFAGYFPRCLQTLGKAENLLPCVYKYKYIYIQLYISCSQFFCYYLYGIYICVCDTCMCMILYIDVYNLIMMPCSCAKAHTWTGI